MRCPQCHQSLTQADHHSMWDEKSDGSMMLESEYRCPNCRRVIRDYEDEYEWLPDDQYPKRY